MIKCVCICVCGGQRSVLSVSLSGSQTHFLETVSLELIDLARLADQRAPGMFQFSLLQHQQTEALQGPFCYCEHWASELRSSSFHGEHSTCWTIFSATWRQVILGWEHHLQVKESSNLGYSVWVKETELCPKGTRCVVVRKVSKEMKGSYIGTFICICCWGCLWVLYFCLKNSSVGNKIVVSFIYHRFWFGSHSKIQKKNLLLCFFHWDIF